MDCTVPVSYTHLDVYKRQGVDLAGEQALGLHIALLRGQHLLRHMADGLFKFTEALGAVHQVAQDEHLPFVADEHERRLDGAGG